MAIHNLDPQVTGNIFRVLTAIYNDTDGDNDGLKRFTIRATNTSGKWVDINIDRSLGVVGTGHIESGQSGGITEASQLYINNMNKITRWRPGAFEIPGNGGGEIRFNVPLDAFDILIEIEVAG
ncbi:hypothetical protein [Sorangium sp. So ce388]|uniref:Uncharacterized protein n=1 Tax=Sorangium cellulosum TaxID=56 RepID=A0A150RBP5_SORCE|nr:hypothetical protein BE17_26785 [Sorangium cellulosum]